MSRTRRLLLISTTSEIGGTERVVLTLAQRFPGHGMDVDTVLAKDERVDETLRWFQEHGASASSSSKVRTIYGPHTIATALELRDLVRDHQPDTVNIHYGGNHLSFKDVVAIRTSGARCVVSIHHTNPIEQARHRTMTALGAPFAHAIIVTTEAGRDILRSAGVRSRRIHVIPPSVPPPASRPSRGDARSRLGLPQDAFVISSLARLTRQKGLLELIEGLGRIPDSSPSIRLLIAGEGPARSELEVLAAARLPGRVHFTGRVRDTADVYAAANVFALPSYMEGFGLVYIEAALHGIPSLGTRVGGIPFAIEDGKTGVLVPPHDVGAIEQAVGAMRANPDKLEEMGVAALERARKEFSPELMCERYGRILFP